MRERRAAVLSGVSAQRRTGAKRLEPRWLAHTCFGLERDKLYGLRGHARIWGLSVGPVQSTLVHVRCHACRSRPAARQSLSHTSYRQARYRRRFEIENKARSAPHARTATYLDHGSGAVGLIGLRLCGCARRARTTRALRHPRALDNRSALSASSGELSV